MVACVSGTVKAVEKLLKLGANVWKMSCDELTALDWSKRFTKTEAAELLECYKYLKLLLPFWFCLFFLETVFFRSLWEMLIS